MLNLQQTINSTPYDFLRANPRLQNNILFLTLGGSHAYGTNIETSDIDIRGVTLNSKSELIGLTSFDQFIDNETDTTIYAFNKFIRLILNCNPNTIELLGCREYAQVSPIGQEILDNKKLFLSKRAIHSFGGYATAQLRRLQNNLARHTVTQEEKEIHILHSCQSAMQSFNDRYTEFEDGSFRLFIDDARKDDFNTEIFADINLKHFPIRDYKSMLSDLGNIIKDYAKVSHRNKKKDDNHLHKHMTHLVRLYLMCIDILEKEEINTYRENDLELLMSIRNGKYMGGEKGIVDDFFELIDELDRKMQYASEHTNLPPTPDMKKVEEFVMSVNERVIRNDY